MTTRAIDILQGQIEQREKSHAEAKRRAMESAREAGEYLNKADKIDADIMALREAIAALSASEYATASVNALSAIAERVREQARGHTGGITR